MNPNLWPKRPSTQLCRWEDKKAIEAEVTHLDWQNADVGNKQTKIKQQTSKKRGSGRVKTWFATVCICWNCVGVRKALVAVQNCSSVIPESANRKWPWPRFSLLSSSKITKTHFGDITPTMWQFSIGSESYCIVVGGWRTIIHTHKRTHPYRINRMEQINSLTQHLSSFPGKLLRNKSKSIFHS